MPTYDVSPDGACIAALGASSLTITAPATGQSISVDLSAFAPDSSETQITWAWVPGVNLFPEFSD